MEANNHRTCENIDVNMYRKCSLIFAFFLFFGVVNGVASSSKGDEQAGAVLFRDKGCAYCHGIGAVGTKKAPGLVNLRKDKAWPPAQINDQILNGGKKMPPFRESLSDAEIAQLVAYLRAKHMPVPPLVDTTATPPPAN